MSIARSLLLGAASSSWLRSHAPRYPFVRRAVRRFMPGETSDAALRAAAELEKAHLQTILTQLGENVADRSEALAVAQHYHGVLDKIRQTGVPAEISVKLTHLGLDIDPSLTLAQMLELAAHAAPSVVWIDMESSKYVDATLECYRQTRRHAHNVGVCLQSYLRRTHKDLEDLLPLGPAIRLVKGAYKEAPDIAFPHKRDVDENYFQLAVKLLSPAARANGTRAAIASHDLQLIRRIQNYTGEQQLPRSAFEFQMLYGIQRGAQLRLAADGWPTRVLISYGDYWFPWFMRRLAERPANLWFIVKNLVS